MSIARNNLVKLSELSGPEQQKKEIYKALGDLSQYEILDEDLLVAVYVQSNVLANIKGPDGKMIELVGTQKKTDTDRYEGKAALLIKKGPNAFKFHPNGQPYEGIVPDDGDWLLMYAHDGRDIHLKDKSASDGVLCRLVHFKSIRMKLSDPRIAF